MHNPYTCYYGHPSPAGPQVYLDEAGKHAKTEVGLRLAKIFIKRAYVLDTNRSITVRELKDVVYAGDHMNDDEDVTNFNLDAKIKNEVQALLEEFGYNNVAVDENDGRNVSNNDMANEQMGILSSGVADNRNTTDLSVSTLEQGNEDEDPEDSESSLSEVAAWLSRTGDERCPVRERIAKEVFHAQRHFAELENKRRSNKVEPLLEKGDIVSILVEGNTRAAVDAPYLPCMVVETRFYKNNGVSYKLCSKVGYLKKRFFRQDLVHCILVEGNTRAAVDAPRFYKNNGVSYKLCSKVGYLKKRFFRQDLVHCPDVNGAKYSQKCTPAKKVSQLQQLVLYLIQLEELYSASVRQTARKASVAYVKRVAGFVHLGATKVEVLTLTAPTVCQKLMIYMKKHIMK
eukprot:CAMPEP_0172434680 /NCGR_PEP_ID=MMETSP1064-20121228/70761_1 /TAXON_ID=202472 /ORGANISM="Aulacoseira subarctica , Strain CCAP 1002/5" /LENGTH=399 /DNA_ID=CAMNT_0013182915 /DNA_START=96 /DNA_END=1295 /DNA_ORIENTATION=+